MGTDKYSNFVFHATETNGGYLMTSNDITVEPADSPHANMGIQFQTAAMFVANGQTQDVKLMFDVTELDPMKHITAMELNFDGTSSSNGVTMAVRMAPRFTDILGDYRRGAGRPALAARGASPAPG